MIQAGRAALPVVIRRCIWSERCSYDSYNCVCFVGKSMLSYRKGLCETNKTFLWNKIETKNQNGFKNETVLMKKIKKRGLKNG